MDIDYQIFTWFQLHHISYLDYFFRDITAFGGPTGTIMILSFMVALLFILKQHRLAIMNLVTFLSTVGIVTVLKILIARPRPLPYDPDHMGFIDIDAIPVPHFASFPSGHTASAVVLYLMLALTAARIIPQAKHFLVGFALFLAVVIGVSRIYLGAHWMSDVIAAYILGIGIIQCWDFFGHNVLSPPRQSSL